jgi:hypothetical protein
MPKPPAPKNDPELDAALAEREAFEVGFKRSRRGNLWRNWEGMTLTVFARDDGRFGWCIVDAEGDKRFSRKAYEDEEWAIGALWDEVSDF